MSATLFISDLHLSAERPATNSLFVDFLRGAAARASALYILGDLFDYWAGDDDLGEAFNRSIIASLRKLSDGGVALYFMHGNRDFLIGDAFADAARAHMLADPSEIDLYGVRVLLMHGDLLCTDDLRYQAFRKQVRDPAWRAQFLAKPLLERKRLIDDLRTMSEQEKDGKSAEIMDVSLASVDATLRAHNYPLLIHGHTHRPARHEHKVDGRRCERWVLSDWYDRGAYLRYDPEGLRAISLA